MTKSYEYEIQVCTTYGWEMVTTEETRKEAIIRIQEYRDNQPDVYRIKKVKKKRGLKN